MSTVRDPSAGRPGQPTNPAQAAPPVAQVGGLPHVAGAAPDRIRLRALPISWPGRWAVWRAVPGWLVSLVVHAVLLIVLGLVQCPQQRRPLGFQLLVGRAEPMDQVQLFELQPVVLAAQSAGGAPSAGNAFSAPSAVRLPEPAVQLPGTLDVTATIGPIDDFARQIAPKEDLRLGINAFGAAGLQGRAGPQRRDLLIEYGGNERSEAAVAAALEWLAAHQQQDGGWSFDHRRGSCRGRCGNPGDAVAARNAATALALLPLLGAGHTHQQGQYADVVDRGLKYLLRHQRRVRGGGSWHERQGMMYSHGLAAIAVCEAYAMTQDPRLQQPAQAAIDFIVYAQDPVRGGWRYAPRRGSDTSVVGWQIMALKSAHMAQLHVPRRTIDAAGRFLDFIAVGQGAYYGYDIPEQLPSTTAVGLLCRMYLGWDRQQPALQRGVQWLAEMGPAKSGEDVAYMYFNYYATQVLHQFDGPFWPKWNESIRDWLIETQETSGHQAGSWYMTGGFDSAAGGRLYCTSMAAMILEVYYRYMPIYSKRAVEDEFPL